MLQRTNHLGEGHVSGAPKGHLPATDAQREEGSNPLLSTIARIRDQHRRRTFAMEQRKRMDLALGSYLRLGLGWHRQLPKAESDAIKAKANLLVEIGEAEFKLTVLNQKGEYSGKDKLAVRRALAKLEAADSAYHNSREIILASIQARAPFDHIEEGTTLELESMAKSLPVWPWVESIRGLGASSLATIIGEAGDLWPVRLDENGKVLSGYANPSKLWKRMGLAPISKGGITRAGSIWAKRGGLAKEDWIVAGYSPMRRARMFVIGDVLIKQNSPYRDIYLARKQYERERAEAAGLTVAPAAKIPKGKAAEFISDGHIHRRAQRYMEKRLLRDLWSEWRQASL